MLLGDVRLPNLLDCKQSEDIVTMTLHIPTDLAYFSGHFSNIAIVPGVVQLHWAVQFANNVFSVNNIITHGSKIKFSKIMLPNDTIFLRLEHLPEKNLVVYSYTTQTGEYYSSGCFNHHEK